MVLNIRYSEYLFCSQINEIPHVPACAVVTAVTFRNDILIAGERGAQRRRSAPPLRPPLRINK